MTHDEQGSRYVNKKKKKALWKVSEQTWNKSLTLLTSQKWESRSIRGLVQTVPADDGCHSKTQGPFVTRTINPTPTPLHAMHACSEVKVIYVVMVYPTLHMTTPLKGTGWRVRTTHHSTHPPPHHTSLTSPVMWATTKVWQIGADVIDYFAWRANPIKPPSLCGYHVINHQRRYEGNMYSLSPINHPYSSSESQLSNVHEMVWR